MWLRERYLSFSLFYFLAKMAYEIDQGKLESMQGYFDGIGIDPQGNRREWTLLEGNLGIFESMAERVFHGLNGSKAVAVYCEGLPREGWHSADFLTDESADPYICGHYSHGVLGDKSGVFVKLEREGKSLDRLEFLLGDDPMIARFGNVALCVSVKPNDGKEDREKYLIVLAGALTPE